MRNIDNSLIIQVIPQNFVPINLYNIQNFKKNGHTKFDSQ